jgi:hypothetical protein
MTLPPKPATIRYRSGWCSAGTVLFIPLLILLASLTSTPALADDRDQFSATVPVDATADSVVKAREAARLDGQRRALAAVLQQLSGSTTPVKPPKLDDDAITNLVTSFQVADERMSAIRYLANYTFHFRQDATRRLMQNAGIAANASATGSTPNTTAPGGPSQPTKPMVLLPVFQAAGQSRLWEDPNPWREAWERQPGGGPLLVPLGDAGDVTAIDADKALDGDADALMAIDRHNGSDEAVLAVAAMQGPADHPTGVDVTLRRYRGGQLVGTLKAPVNANPDETGDALLGRALTTVVADIKSGGWQKDAIAGYDQQGSLTAVLPITGLDDWVGARQRIAAVPAVKKLVLATLSRQEATIEIDYLGNIGQLKAALAGIGLDLVHGDPQGASTWRLARTGASAQ